jgi:adenine-specific DNA methylase
MSRSSTINAVVPNEILPGRYTNLDEDKLRGGYYTSPQVAEWLCAWAIRSEKDRVLEPSSGSGAFLKAAAHRLLELGASQTAIGKNLTGVEIIPAEAKLATVQLAELLGSKGKQIVRTSDFFSWWQERDWTAFDAVVGNPPFIRYQSFPEPHRTIAMEIMGDQGLTPNRLTNIWVPFVVAAVASLKKGGRLGLVLPAELLQVTYAAQLRSFLTDNFTRIDIMACNELFFEKAEQEVVLLLADGALGKTKPDNKCRVAMTEADSVSEIIGKRADLVLKKAQPKTIQHDNEKWLKYFLSATEIEFMRELRASGNATPLSTHAEIDVGVVTGKNEFFVLTNAQVEELNLHGFTIPLISRSAHLRGAKIGKADWKALSAAGDRVHLLDLKSVPDSKLPVELLRYIKEAEKKLIHKGYKCSIRTPWYAVPSIWVPDGFLFRQIYDFPRMVLNSSGATSTDTIHRVTGKTDKPERIIANTYTWLSAASAEIEGRSYGGGVLELEPTEAERMLMPASLNGALPVSECDRLTRAGKLDEVLEENARLILIEHMGLTKAESHVLRDIWVKMRDRRMARRPKSRKNVVEV